MSSRIYPSPFRGLAYTVTKTPTFDTTVQSSISNVEARIANTINPIWEWQLMYEVLFNTLAKSAPGFAPYTDLQQLMGFYLASGGQFDDFLYDDVDDDSVVNQTMQLVTDGTTYYTPIQRNMGGQFFEDVTDLNPLNGSGLTVKANGVSQIIGTCGMGGANAQLKGPGLTIPGFSFSGLYLQWCSAPTAPITASFNFYFRVRFATDRLDFEKFVYSLWTIGGSEGRNGSGILKLKNARQAGA